QHDGEAQVAKGLRHGAHVVDGVAQRRLGVGAVADQQRDALLRPRRLGGGGNGREQAGGDRHRDLPPHPQLAHYPLPTAVRYPTDAQAAGLVRSCQRVDGAVKPRISSPTAAPRRPLAGVPTVAEYRTADGATLRTAAPAARASTSAGRLRRLEARALPPLRRRRAPCASRTRQGTV